MTFESKYGEAEIDKILDAYEAGAERKALCARCGISVRTLFRWQARRGSNRPALLKLVSSLRDENMRLRERLGEVDGEAAAALR
jgi:hypothetical protein